MTVYGQKGYWYGSLNVGGINIPIETHQMFHEITIRSHIHMDLPSLTLHFLDMGGLMVQKIVLRDGMPIIAGMGDGLQSMPTPATFLCAGAPQVAPGPGADEVQQKALLAYPEWSRKIWDKSTTGTSDDVISRLAGEAGLGSITHKAQDKQKWLPNNRTLAEYSKFVQGRAYFGPMSAPVQAIRESGVLVYKDLLRLLHEPPVGATIGIGDGKIPYLEHMFTSKAKVYNAVRGYGSTSIVDMGTGVIDEFNKVEVKLPSQRTDTEESDSSDEFFGIGEVWSKATGSLGVRVEWSPIDGGNVHSKYYSAMHHNARIKGLFSEDVKVLLDVESGKDLLEMVSFHPFDKNTGRTIAAYAGNYICTGKMRMLRHNRYFEVLTLTSTGPFV